MLYQMIRTIEGNRFAALVCTEIGDLKKLPYRDRYNPELAVYFTMLKRIADQHYINDKCAVIRYTRRKIIAGFSAQQAKHLFLLWQDSGDYAWSRDQINLDDRAIDGHQRTYATGERHVSGAKARRRSSLELLIMVKLGPNHFSLN